MQVLISCGGLATRLRPLTKKIPKSMVEIEGKPFLEHQLNLLKKNGLKDIVLSIGFKGNQIRKYFATGKKFGVKIKYNPDGKKLLGTGGAIKKAEKLLNDAFLVIYGDSYLPFDFQKAINYFNRFQKLGLMTVFKNANRYEPSNVEVQGNLVKSYSKKRKTKKMLYIDYGVSIFKKEVLKNFPADTAFDLSLIHKDLIKKKQLLAFPVKQRFYQIGSFDGLEEFRQYLKNN